MYIRHIALPTLAVLVLTEVGIVTRDTEVATEVDTEAATEADLKLTQDQDQELEI